MVTVAIVLFIVCLGVFIYSVPKQKPILGTMSLTATFTLPVIGFLVCMQLSTTALPEGYQSVPSYCVVNDAVICVEPARAKYNDGYYERSGFGKAWWIPGAATNFEKIDSLERIFCKDCEVFCSLDYCVLCGAHLKDSACTHWESRNMSYCGGCGEPIESKEK